MRYIILCKDQYYVEVCFVSIYKPYAGSHTVTGFAKMCIVCTITSIQKYHFKIFNLYVANISRLYKAPCTLSTNL